MKAPVPPRYERRRASDFERELLARAESWLPTWDANEPDDFGRSVLRVAARFASEVAERLDQAGDKLQLGLLDWLGVRAAAARPARMPVVFKMAAQAARSVLVAPPLRMQVDVAGSPVVFESETPIRLVPGRLKLVVAVDATEDRLFLPPADLTEIEPAPPAPAEWRVKSSVSEGSTTVQLDPADGLVKDLIVEIGGAQYRIVGVSQESKDLVTIEPQVPAGGFASNDVVRRVMSFLPFAGARNRQEHVLYLGDPDLLNVEAKATLDVLGEAARLKSLTWEYWGKGDPAFKDDEVRWRELELDLEQPADAAVRLVKPKGAVEPLPLGTVKGARWIRARTGSLARGAQPLLTDEFALRVNHTDEKPDAQASTEEQPPDAADDATESPNAQAMANSTPLALTSFFYPLGREPRLFDAFYLGSTEAFSKRGATAVVHLTLADPTVASHAIVSTESGSRLAGIGNDGALHWFTIDGDGRMENLGAPLFPPNPSFGAGDPAPEAPIRLDAKPWRPPIWQRPSPDAPSTTELLLAASSGVSVWVWREQSDGGATKGWVALGAVTSDPDPKRKIAGLAVAGTGIEAAIVALVDRRLVARTLESNWLPFGAQGDVEIDAIVSVLGSSAATLVAVGSSPTRSGGVYVVRPGETTEHRAIDEVAGIDPAVRPLAFERADGNPVPDVIVATRAIGSKPAELVTLLGDGKVGERLPLEEGERVLGIAGQLAPPTSSPARMQVAAVVESGGRASVVLWTPFGSESNGLPSLRRSELLPSVPPDGDVPTLVGKHVVVPGTHGEALVSDLDEQRSVKLDMLIEPGVRVSSSGAAIQPGDSLALTATGGVHVVEGPAFSRDVDTLYGLRTDSPGSAGPLALVPRLFLTRAEGAIGTVTKVTKTPTLTLEVEAGLSIPADSILLLAVGDAPDTARRQFKVVGPGTAADTIKLVPEGGEGVDLPNAPFDVEYWQEASFPSEASPVVFSVDPPAIRAWSSARIERTTFAFSDPAAKLLPHVFVSDLDRRLVIGPLGPDRPAPGTRQAELDAPFAQWRRELQDTSSNPELSWEYWDGTSWSSLSVKDGTRNFRSTGVVTFEVPGDLRPGDWSGKSDFWIRARLIGGDYGKDVVVTTTRPIPGKPDGTTEQRSQRETAGHSPPRVLDLSISYAVSKATRPAFVLTEDSRGLRDRSDANRTPGALVEAFVPLSVALARLRESTAVPSASGVVPESGRALFLGFTKELSGSNVNVLLLVPRGMSQDAHAPLEVEALVGDRFVPLVAQDETRALGESGLVRMSLPEKPTEVELFGESLRWIRLSPTRQADAWQPHLEGAYLNAVWASATETLTRELLGSSEGEPDLRVKLARPPVLSGSLELRVREPLGEEERAALVRDDPSAVLSVDRSLPGHWVRWSRVDDPDDAEQGARVYALDDASGVIRFGDGRHGAIPPIGRNSIVAFSYQRTEPATSPGDVPSNAVTARTKINLVTPVEGAEAAFAAQDAAGGAPPEPVERVRRFAGARLRHRGRAILPRDLEDLALESSPAIAQVRALPAGRRIRLVVVMRGADPTPSEPQKRELGRLLRGAALPAAARPALEVVSPKVRRLRIALRLRVAALDDSGGVAEQAERRLLAYLDPAVGGRSGTGWPLGTSPSADDVAFALRDLPRMVGSDAPDLREIDATGALRPWPASLAPDELPQLAARDLRIAFDATEDAA